MALTDKLTAIADAIRSKTGSTDPLTLDGMVTAVEGIQAGGSGGDDLARKIVERTVTEYRDVNCSEIREYVFYQCRNLVSVDLPSCTKIGTYAFSNSTLESISLPACTTIGASSFSSCSNLISLDLPSCTTLPYSAFGNCSKLSSVKLESCTTVGTNSFNNCYRLVSVVLSSPSMCSLTATNAFNGCYHILGTVNSTYNPSGAKDGYIYVPDVLVEDYKANSNWSTYATQIKPLSYYDTAVYQLAAATYNSTERPGLTLTINDDESITITNNIGATTDAVIVNLTNPSVFTTHIKSEAINNITDELFTLTTGDIVNAEIDIIDNPNNLTVAMGWRKTGTSESFSEVSVSDTSVDKSIAVATTAYASISCGFLYIDGSFANGTSITVNPHFKVNGQRYI